MGLPVAVVWSLNDPATVPEEVKGLVIVGGVKAVIERLSKVMTLPEVPFAE